MTCNVRYPESCDIGSTLVSVYVPPYIICLLCRVSSYLSMLSANFVESLKSGFSSALVEASLVTPVGPINVFQGLPCVISLVALGYIVMCF
jgi:hypothetical protein